MVGLAPGSAAALQPMPLTREPPRERLGIDGDSLHLVIVEDIGSAVEDEGAAAATAAEGAGVAEPATRFAAGPDADLPQVGEASALAVADPDATVHLDPPLVIAPPGRERRIVSARRGTTLMDLLSDADVPASEAAQAITALRTVYDPRRLRAGQEVTMVFEPRRGAPDRFVGLELNTDPVRSISVARDDDGGFASSENVKTVERRTSAATGIIRSSLFEAGQAANVPVAVMMDMIRLFSHEVDFQRDLQPNDRFAVFYENETTEDGTLVRHGAILFASLVLSGKEMSLYRHTPSGGADYFDRDGGSIRRSLLRTPIEGAKLTSGFGLRHHPILGYTKLHKGLDFGAPTGTPVFAAGRGVIEEIGRKGDYGNYVRIRHDTDTATAYAHLSRFASGMTKGTRVDQGEVVAFVGTTGRSTGPHLHYEVQLKGKSVDPRRIDLPTGEKLTGRALAEFQATRQAIDSAFAAANGAVPGVGLVSAPEAIVLPKRRVCDSEPGC